MAAQEFPSYSPDEDLKWQEELRSCDYNLALDICTKAVHLISGPAEALGLKWALDDNLRFCHAKVLDRLPCRPVSVRFEALPEDILSFLGRLSDT